ncbi:MAG: hypothetical protein RBR43_08595 [Desulfuromonadaceae bacterium]|nr:hypothetical protein [Desulfuromonas sp.]MDY0185920.1 hypothetical protein [Desulfuromonadaceae bacterium]
MGAFAVGFYGGSGYPTHYGNIIAPRRLQTYRALNEYWDVTTGLSASLLSIEYYQMMLYPLCNTYVKVDSIAPALSRFCPEYLLTVPSLQSRST